MSEHKEPIPSMIYNASVGGHVTNSQQIIDENENKEQSQINAEVKETLGQGSSVDNRINQAKNDIIGGASSNGNTLKKIEDRVSPLESAVGSGGSVDIRIAAAKSEIIGNATSACNTLGKAEVKINNETARAQAAEEQLSTLYNNLQQSKPIPVTNLPASGQSGAIYRLAGTTSYSDYMWNGSQWVLMATYNNAIDDEPTARSNNLVKSGGVVTFVKKHIDGYDQTVDLSGLTKYAGFIDGTKWQTNAGGSTENRHCIVVLNDIIDTVTIQTKNTVNYDTAVAFLSEVPVEPVTAGSDVEGLISPKVDLFAPSTVTLDVPAGTKCLYFLTEFWGSDRTPLYVSIHKDSIVEEVIQEIENTSPRETIIVASDGSGNYTGLHAALKFCKLNSDKFYNVYIKEGIYDVSAEWTTQELDNANYPNGFVGTEVPSNVNIIGVGVRENIVIKAQPISGYTWENTWTHISTLNVFGGSIIKNITVEANGLRYAIHDDFSSSANKTTTYENCVIVYNDTTTHSSLGCGSHNGQTMNIRKCVIMPSLGWHGHNPASAGSTLNVEDSIIGTVELYDYLTGYEQNVNIKNSECGIINYGKVVSGSRQWMNINIIGCYAPFNTGEDGVNIQMDGIAKYISSLSISKGTPVKRVNALKVEAITSEIGFYGIALETIPATEGRVGLPTWGNIVSKGYVNSTILGLLNLSVGDIIGISNGTYSVVENGGIGKVEFIQNSVAYIRLF